MLFLSFLILLLIVPQSCPTSVPSQISPSITKISPSITVPISIPPDTIDFTIPPGTNPSTSLTHFASTHHLAPPHIAELSNYVRKQALLAGHIPHTRIIEVPESATVDEYTIHYEPLISCLTDPSYDYTIQRTHSVALPPTFATTLALTSTSICLPPHRDGGIQVDVFLVYARMQYSYTGNFSTAIIMETKAGKVTHWDPHWDPHDPHWDPHWDPLSPAISPTLAISPYLPSTPPPPPPAASNPSITLLLVSHDGGTNTTYAVFHDVITALTHTLTALNQPTNFRLCSSLLDPLCSSASLHELAQTSTIVVIAPHTLVRVTADDVPVVLKTAYLPATTILYNYEVVPAVANQGSGSAVSEEVVELYRRYTTWDYCEANVETLKQHGVTATVVPLGFALVDLPKRGAEDIDVLFYGTVTGYRRSVIDELRAGGVKVLVITDGTWGLYGGSLIDLIGRSKVVLNLNTWESVGEWKITRFWRALVMGKVVVSERSGVVEEGEFEEGIVFAERGMLVEMIKEWVGKSDEERRQRGEVGTDVLKRTDMKEALRNALRIDRRLGTHTEL